MKKNHLLCLMATFYLLIADLSAQQSFSLDTEFSGDGVVYFDSFHGARVQLQSDDKIIVMTQDTLYRLNLDGSRDTTFGSGGTIFMTSLLFPLLKYGCGIAKRMCLLMMIYFITTCLMIVFQAHSAMVCRIYTHVRQLLINMTI